MPEAGSGPFRRQASASRPSISTLSSIRAPSLRFSGSAPRTRWRLGKVVLFEPGLPRKFASIAECKRAGSQSGANPKPMCGKP